MVVSTEIKTHNVRAVSSVLFGDLTGTKARETAYQRALRNCSKEVKGEVSMYVILAKGYVQPSTHPGRRLLLVTRNRHLS